MRPLISITVAVFAIALTGCFSTRPSDRIAGVFKNAQGQHVWLTPEGHIYESESRVAGDQLHYIGTISPEKKQPTTIHVTTPSTGLRNWMGATIQFNNNFTRFDVFGYEPKEKPTKPPQSSYERVY